MDRSIPEIFDQINGLPQYIRHLVQSRMDIRTSKLLSKIAAVNHVLSITVEPDDSDDYGLILAEKLLGKLNGFLFYNGLIFDHNLKMYLGPNGMHDKDSELF